MSLTCHPTVLQDMPRLAIKRVAPSGVQSWKGPKNRQNGLLFHQKPVATMRNGGWRMSSNKLWKKTCMTVFFQKKTFKFTSAICRENRAQWREFVRNVGWLKNQPQKTYRGDGAIRGCQGANPIPHGESISNIFIQS